MYLFAGLQGHGTSRAPGASGTPTEWTHGMKAPLSPSTSCTRAPMRVIIRMLTTTYGLSVISTPICAIGLPSGPIENGTTYIVRPRMHPSKSVRSVARIFAGSTQLLVGPASSSRSLQMKVRSSTRATSDGSERARKLFGRLPASSRCRVPAATIASHSDAYSSALPSHQAMRSGVASVAICRTHSISRRCATPDGAFTDAASAEKDSLFMVSPPKTHETKRDRKL